MSQRRRAAPQEGARGERGETARLSRAVWAVSLPLLFAEVGETIIHATDTMFLARVGTTELGAIALGDSLRELWIVPVVGLVDAVQIVIARRRGEERLAGVGATFNRGLWLAILVSVVLAVGLRVFASGLSRQTATGEVASAVDAFLRIAAYGVVFHAVNLVFSALYVGLGRTRVLIGATLVLAVTNLVFGYAFILGSLGFPRLGIRGAAIAFVVAEAATFVFLVIHLLVTLDVRTLGLFRRRPREDGPSTPSLVRMSVPVALDALVEGARWLLFFVILDRVGEEALAWSNVVYVCLIVFLIPTEAFWDAVSSTVSRLIGRGQRAAIGALVRKTIWSTFLVSLPLVAVVLLFPRLVLPVFGVDPEGVAGALGTVQLLAATMLVVIPAEMWLAAMFGTGDTDASFAIEVASTAAMLGWAYVAAFVLELELPYIWLSVAIASLVGLALSYGWMRGGLWQRRRI